MHLEVIVRASQVTFPDVSDRFDEIRIRCCIYYEIIQTGGAFSHPLNVSLVSPDFAYDPAI